MVLNLPLIVAYLAFLLPISIYCLVLAMINRRSNPLMVSGMWDCVGLLLACSGLLLVYGPGIIINRFRAWPVTWLIVWGIYYFVVLAGVLLMIWSRRRKTVIYNIDVDAFHQLLGRVLERQNLAGLREGRRVVIALREEEPFASAGSTETAISGTPLRAQQQALAMSPLPLDETRRAVLDVEPFAAMSNLTLNWRQASKSLRAQIEDELRPNLDECRALDNPSAGWLLGIGTLMSAFVLMVMGAVVVIEIFQRN